MAKREMRATDTVPSISGGAVLGDAEILAMIPAARERAMLERRAGLRARTARYSEAKKQIMMELTTGALLGVPIHSVAALRGMTARQLAALAVTPSGSILHWERLDIDLSVAALVREALGEAAIQSLFGAAGGRSTSPKKTEAARANGAKGGRPRAAADR